jgi:DNA-binding CsgD family transcriptional regulator
MNHLTRSDYAGALRLLARLEAESGDLECFARASVAALGAFVASELATLSVCDLLTGHRQVVALAGLRLGEEDIACFDRHFFEHPLVRHHGIDGGRAALYADCYQRVGLDRAIAVPLFVDGRTLVSIVLNRRGLDFSERDRERLELLRPHLAFLYRQACAATPPSRVPAAAAPLAPAEPECMPSGLTVREGEVMHWLSRGKTDSEIAALLAISPRTVHKHLEHIYVKLGVETRTAAVMRALAIRSPDGRTGAKGISGVSLAMREQAAHTQPG